MVEQVNGWKNEWTIACSIGCVESSKHLEFTNANWPLPKRVGHWVGISNAKHLGSFRGTGEAEMPSKNAAPLQLWLFVQPGTQQLYCPGSNPVPPNDPKR